MARKISGQQAQTKLLKAEGHEIFSGKGKKPPTVKDFELAITSATLR